MWLVFNLYFCVVAVTGNAQHVRQQAEQAQAVAQGTSADPSQADADRLQQEYYTYQSDEAASGLTGGAAGHVGAGAGARPSSSGTQRRKTGSQAVSTTGRPVSSASGHKSTAGALHRPGSSASKKGKDPNDLGSLRDSAQWGKASASGVDSPKAAEFPQARGLVKDSLDNKKRIAKHNW